MHLTSGSFPIVVWDGMSTNPFRTKREQNIDPNYQDWDRITQEVIATQTFLSENFGFSVGIELELDATSGFLYIPVMDGIPTGEPIDLPGKSAIVINKDDETICVYLNGAWKSAALT